MFYRFIEEGKIHQRPKGNKMEFLHCYQVNLLKNKVTRQNKVKTSNYCSFKLTIFASVMECFMRLLMKNDLILTQCPVIIGAASFLYYITDWTESL